ncbi:PEST proteolytic signal-containing nuclear protein-like [Actinia tenebrosa]|uniref:PEST proteolytic signal-containing nuclear protein n=1 Tax=Actinia tenebrosa TaxID=6105 RepID=A0A6P8IUY8_ACTTE|nr:PEST proteolytic signal-containing nuclear protein-like [Actinia tenebrosa]
MNNKPSSFTWMGKRKSGPIETIKPLELSGSKGGGGITIKLNAPAKKKKAEPVIQKKAGSVAAAFGNDESDEEEEIPPEAKMRMRNIGKDTPTSAGPNSFNKGKQGFTHTRKVFEKKLNETKPP